MIPDGWGINAVCIFIPLPYLRNVRSKIPSDGFTTSEIFCTQTQAKDNETDIRTAQALKVTLTFQYLARELKFCIGHTIVIFATK